MSELCVLYVTKKLENISALCNNDKYCRLNS